MKVSEEHYTQLKDAMTGIMRRYPSAAKDYKDQGLSDERYGWDAYHIAKQSFTQELKDSLQKAYYFNFHLDTAFKSIIKEYKQEV